jgi:predicted secreted protein
MDINWFIVLTSYFVVWWTVLFAVLPYGVERDDKPQPGHDAGAPKKPHIGRKFLLTSVLSAVIWLMLYFMIAAGWLDYLVYWFGGSDAADRISDSLHSMGWA